MVAWSMVCPSPASPIFQRLRGLQTIYGKANLDGTTILVVVLAGAEVMGQLGGWVADQKGRRRVRPAGQSA